MKTKETQNKLVLMLNKQTIANLNHRELRRIRGRGMNVEPVIIDGLDENSETCSPLDTGITPFSP